MRKAMLVLAIAVSLAGAGTAHAGCMATVELSPLPGAVDPGQPWVVDLTVLRHGKTPLDDATPSVIVTNDATGEQATFPARLVDGTEGRYRAEVTFPSSGSWSVAASDGFPVAECARTHTFGSFEIGGPAQSPPANDAPAPAASPQVDVPTLAATGGRPFPVWPVVGGVLGAIAATMVLIGLGRHRLGRTA